MCSHEGQLTQEQLKVALVAEESVSPQPACGRVCCAMAAADFVWPQNRVINNGDCTLLTPHPLT